MNYDNTMIELLEFALIPGLVGGLVLGAAGAYFLGVRDPFLIALAAVVTGIFGFAVVDLGIPWKRRKS